MFEDIRKGKKQYLAECKKDKNIPLDSSILFPVIFTDSGFTGNNICESTLYNLSSQLEIIRRGRKDEFEKNHMNTLDINELSTESRSSLYANYCIELGEAILMYIKSSCITNFSTAIEFSKFHDFGFTNYYNIPAKFNILMEDAIKMIRQVYIKEFMHKIMKIDGSDESIIDLRAYKTNISFQIAQVLFRVMNQAIEEEINEISDYQSSPIYNFMKQNFDKMNIKEELSDVKCKLILKNLLFGLPQTMYDNFLLPMCDSILDYVVVTASRISIY